MAQMIVLYPDGVTPQYSNGVLDLRGAGAPPVVIPPNPNPGPTPPSGPGIITLPNQPNVMNGIFTYPKGGQARPYSSGLGGNLVLAIPFQIPSNVTVQPNRLGFMKVAVYPGNIDVARSVQVEVNGQIVLPWQGPMEYSNAPSLNFTIGNPNPYNVGAFLNFGPGDNVIFKVQNPYQENSNILFDCADPARA